MKTAGLISDTHLNACSVRLMDRLAACFASIDMILHAGDITHPDVLDMLESLAPVTAVAGNMDTHPLLATLPSRRVLRIEDARVGLIHGWGGSQGIIQRVLAGFDPGSVDIIVHGHSHAPHVTRTATCLVINPGSPTDCRGAPYPSVAILKIDGAAAEAEIISITV
ncbi:metallophosphoesterase [bacterium]|nr:metallophosphoesterase [candidate division CSSED10-310 bacterium]